MASSVLVPSIADGLPDFSSEAYKSAYSRINAIVIEGEQEAHDNYISLGSLLHNNFKQALAANQVVTCLVIQALMIEAFAIAAYHIYIPVADPFARKITEGVVKDEYTHLNYGQEWLKANFEASRSEIEQANRTNLPIIRRMLEQVANDAAELHMEKESLIEDFLIAYQEALMEIGFSPRDLARMSAAALVS